MGQLKFNLLFVEQWDTQTIQVIGKFTLDREKDQPTGLFFTLQKYGRRLENSERPFLCIQLAKKTINNSFYVNNLLKINY